MPQCPGIPNTRLILPGVHVARYVYVPQCPGIPNTRLILSGVHVAEDVCA